MDERMTSQRPLAVVTGGSAGIGLELAKLFAGNGHDLVIVGSSERVSQAAKSLRSSGADVVPVRADLATAEGSRAVVEAVTATGRPPQALVLNAGIALGGAFLELPLERQLQLVELNVMSVLRLSYALVPSMVEAGKGRVLMVSSVSAFTPTPFESVYGPSKAFLTSFGHVLREELRDTGVGVTLLHPGATATNFHATAGMGDTAFGDNSWKNDPALVAAQGFEAFRKGLSSAVGGDARTQEDAAAMGRMSPEEKAERHAKMTRPDRRPS